MTDQAANPRAVRAAARARNAPQSGRIRKPRVKAEIIAAMAQSIVTGEIQPGAFLPTEAELCEQYGVSRTVIREASKVLESKGLLSIRSRVGTQVQAKDTWNLLDPDMLAWAGNFSGHPEYLTSLMEMRRIIEPAVAELAALRATQADIARLENAFERMVTYQQIDARRFSEADADFHMTLMMASRNPVLIQLGYIIGQPLQALLMRTARAGTRHQHSLNLHGEIVAAVRGRNPQKARQANQTIVDDATRDLKLMSQDA